MSNTPQHRISLLVGGKQITGWETYEIRTALSDPVGSFRMKMPFDRAAWDLCRPDARVQVLIDDVAIITGFVDDEEAPSDDEVIEIAGQCRLGRLARDAAPGINFNGIGMLQLIEKLASPFFERVTFSNARNRGVLRGKGKKARAGDEPVKINTMQGTRIEPGQTRYATIERMLEQAGLLAWSSGDGKELIVSKPNYEQEIQFSFFRAAAGSDRTAEDNVLSMGIKRSTGDRYSRVIVVGSGTGTDVNYGPAVCARYGEAKNNPDTHEGDGIDFTEPKRLIVQRSVQSKAECDELAAQEMARRDAQAQVITVRAKGHGQVVAGQYPTIFAPDTLAFAEDERTGIFDVYVIDSCTHRSGREGGEETEMVLVLKGSELSR